MLIEVAWLPPVTFCDTIIANLVVFIVLFVGICSQYNKVNDEIFLKIITLLSGWMFVYSLHLLLWFDRALIGFQFYAEIPIINIRGYNIVFSAGVDGISLCFMILTTFIMTLCLISASSITKRVKDFAIYLMIIEILLIFTFVTTDLIFFFIFFESVLIPMFIVIGIWGARQRKIRASYMFFLYTVLGSFFMLYAIYYLSTIIRSTQFHTLLPCYYTRDEQIILWICFFIPFAIKIPMIPFHIWLPEAHVEAPTIGSVILASILLKLGGYGLIRFVITMLPYATVKFLPLVEVLGIISVMYASCATIVQIDIKRIIAYSSIAHMNLIVLGLFSCTFHGINGAIYLMIGHGIVSAALFFCVGVLYDRYHTRLIHRYGGLVQIMPTFAAYFFMFSLSNMGFPGTSNFIGEILIFTGIFKANTWVIMFAATGVVLSAVYAIWLFNRVVFGSFKILKVEPKYNVDDRGSDLNRHESFIFIVLLSSMMLLGLNSSAVTAITESSVQGIMNCWAAYRGN